LPGFTYTARFLPGPLVLWGKICVFGGVTLVKFAFQGLNIMLFGVASIRGHEKQPKSVKIAQFHRKTVELATLQEIGETLKMCLL